MPAPCPAPLEAFDVAVGDHGGDEDVGHPEADQDDAGDHLLAVRAAQLPADGLATTQDEDEDGEESHDAEDRHRHGQGARRHVELVAVHRVVHGSHGPGDADAQEDVDGVGAGHVADGGVGVAVVDGGYFAGEGVWGTEKTVSHALRFILNLHICVQRLPACLSGHRSCREFKSTALPDIAVFKSTALPDIAVFKSTAFPDIAVFKSAAPPDIAVFKSTALPDIAVFKSAAPPDIAVTLWG